MEIIVGVVSLIVTVIIGGYQIYQSSDKYKQKAINPPKNPTEGFRHNIPHRSIFLGRGKELQEVIADIKSRSFIISIEGIGGIGKTSLAIEAAYNVLDLNIFDKIIWYSAKENNTNILSISNQVIEAFGRLQLLKSSDDEKIAEMKILVGNTKCLIIIDNFEDIEDKKIISFISDIPEPSKVLITTREKKLDIAKRIKLLGLQETDALELLKARSKEIGFIEFNNIEKKSMSHLVQATGGSPLALKWSIGLLKTGVVSIEEIIEMLFNAKGEVFNNLFLKSWSLLKEDSKKILFFLSLFEYPVEKNIITASTNIKHFNFIEAFELLDYLSLVITNNTDKFTSISTHELTKHFVKTKILPNHYEEIVVNACKAYINKIEQDIKEDLENYQFISFQLHNILKICKLCFSVNWTLGMNLLISIKWYLWEKGIWGIRNEMYLQCVQSTKAELNDENLTKLALDIAWVYFRQNAINDATYWLDKIQHVEIGKLSNNAQGTYYSVLGMIHKTKKEYDLSKEYLLKSIEILPSNEKNNLERMRVLTYLGELNRQHGRIDEAKGWFNDTLELAKSINYKSGICWSYQNLASIEIILNNKLEAKSLLNKALIIADAIDRKHTIAECKFLLAEIIKNEDKTQSKKLYDEAKQLYTSLGFQKVYEFNDR